LGQPGKKWGSFRGGGSFWGRFGDHSGVGIILGAVQHSSAKHSVSAHLKLYTNELTIIQCQFIYQYCHEDTGTSVPQEHSASLAVHVGHTLKEKTKKEMMTKYIIH